MLQKSDNSRISDSVGAHVVLGSIVSLPWIWLCWRYWDYYPLWDAAIYYEAALEAARSTVNPLAYNIAGHPTMGYLWLPGLLTRYLGASYRVFLAYNAVLAWIMAIAVADMSMRLLKGERRFVELLLVVGSVMYCPVIVASILQLTPDFGVLVYLLLSARALMHERRLRAFAWGVLACLSKESGVLLFAIELALYVVVFGLRAQTTARRKLMAMVRLSPLILVPLGLGSAVLLFATPNGGAKLWGNVGISDVLRQFSTISFMDNVLPASLATILVLNCMWIPATLLTLAFGFWFVRKVVLALPVTASRDPAFEFAIVTFLAELYLLTRFRTFTNVRYYLPLFPWIILLAARGLLTLGFPRALRLGCQSVVFVALALGNFRSFDPISADVFGTIPFGNQRLFHITSLTGECCGLGRDQLVYNLEFAEMDRLLRQVLPFALAAKDHAVAVHPQADWKLFDSVDPNTLRRGTPRVGSFKVPYTHTWAVGAARAKPEKIYYIALPNMPNTTELVRYAAWYDFRWRRRRFSHSGYRIDVHELTLKH